MAFADRDNCGCTRVRVGSRVSPRLLVREDCEKQRARLLGVLLCRVLPRADRCPYHMARDKRRKETPRRAASLPCLLYTSDAADDLLCVDLGGRRIIKKKKKK